MNSDLKILLVEDDLVTRKIFEKMLNKQPNITWHSVATMQDAVKAFHRFQPDIVVLDINLPDGSGMDLVQPFRQGSGCGLIMMSSHDENIYKVDSLNNGADIYLQKPVSPDYFIASIVALGKRLLQNTNSTANTSTASPEHNWRLHHDHWQLIPPSGQTIELSYNEYVILKALFETREQTITYENAAKLLGRQHCTGNDNALRVLLSRLRKKIQHATADEFRLKTHRQQIWLAFAEKNHHD